MSKYNWDPIEYEKYSRAQQKWALELIDKLSLKGTENVLDLGCGDGKVTAEIARLIPNSTVVGVDSSNEMIDLANEKYPSSLYPNLSFMIMDASRLSFNNRFDVVFSNAALHWVMDHRPVTEGLYKSLRPNGKILLQMGGKGNATMMVSVLEELQSSPDWEPYFVGFEFPYNFMGPEEYTTLLQKSGFREKRIELIPKDMVHSDRNGFEGWIRSAWLPYTGQIPMAKREEFIQAISTKYLEKVPIAPDGTVHVAMIRIEVEAERITIPQ